MEQRFDPKSQSRIPEGQKGVAVVFVTSWRGHEVGGIAQLTVERAKNLYGRGIVKPEGGNYDRDPWRTWNEELTEGALPKRPAESVSKVPTKARTKVAKLEE